MIDMTTAETLDVFAPLPDPSACSSCGADSCSGSCSTSCPVCGASSCVNPGHVPPEEGRGKAVVPTSSRPHGPESLLPVEHVSILRKRHRDREASGGLKYVWDQILPDAGVFVAHVGPAKIGKTTLGMMFAHTAGNGGGELLGRRVHARRVLVLAVEDPIYYTESLTDRFFADEDDVLVFAEPLKSDPETLERIINTIKAQSVGLVVLFSLSAFWRVLDENDNREVQIAAEAIKDAARRSGIPWLLDVHSRKAEGSEGSEIRGAGALAGVLDGWISQRRGARRNGESDSRRYFEVRGRLPHGGLDIAANFDSENNTYNVIEPDKSLSSDVAMRCRALASESAGRIGMGRLIEGLGLKDGGKYRTALRKTLLADGWTYIEDGNRSVWTVAL